LCLYANKVFFNHKFIVNGYCIPSSSRSPLENLAMPEEPFDTDPDDRSASQPPSKSQRKREATALQDLGEQLVELTTAQLNRIPLPDDLRAAVQAAQAITQRGGRKRQLQYIGKLMRRLDDSSAIHSALDTVLPNRRY
jgi:ribosomal 50S subunit-associated protein YjgA (DUF615 family)